jgi:predicted amidohydrolase
MRIACVQSNVTFADPTANAEIAVRRLRDLSKESVDLAIFPEAYLTGYCVDCQTDASRIAIPLGHEAFTMLRHAVEETGVTVVVGFAEAATDGTIYNAAALFEAGAGPRIYRKTHLPELGLDKFVGLGDQLPVFDTRHGKIGILICFDLRPPEPSRVLALAGAELIVLPTNWPRGAEVSAHHVAITRAAENRVFFATCNRVGEENGFQFIGGSKIIGPSGHVLAAAGEGEEIIMADVNLAEATIKRSVMIPGKYETTVFDSRRPELYGSLVDVPR